MSDSLITKKAIASSIKELMKKKEVQKISVADIVENCGINRQTFYYHFKDKYDLVNWIYYNEVVSAITQNRTYENWSQAVLDVLNIMRKEQYFYINALSVTGQNAFQDYFFEATKGILAEMLETIAQEENIEEADIDFMAEFYTYGLVGVTVQWARRGMKQSPEEIVQRLTHLIEDIPYLTTEAYFKKYETKKEI